MTSTARTHNASCHHNDDNQMLVPKYRHCQYQNLNKILAVDDQFEYGQYTIYLVVNQTLASFSV